MCKDPGGVKLDLVFWNYICEFCIFKNYLAQNLQKRNKMQFCVCEHGDLPFWRLILLLLFEDTDVLLWESITMNTLEWEVDQWSKS